MKYKIVWLDKAIEELDRIYDFYFQKNPNVAIKIYNSILADVRYLESFPEIAAIEPLLKDRTKAFRSLVTKNKLFKIIYYFDSQNVFVMSIFCCRRNPKDLK